MAPVPAGHRRPRATGTEAKVPPWEGLDHRRSSRSDLPERRAAPQVEPRRGDWPLDNALAATLQWYRDAAALNTPPARA